MAAFKLAGMRGLQAWASGTGPRVAQRQAAALMSTRLPCPCPCLCYAGAMEDWPALGRWCDPDYLIAVAGPRTVPVEASLSQHRRLRCAAARGLARLVADFVPPLGAFR